MRKYIFGLLLLTLISISSFAQANKEHRGQGYVFVGPGVNSGNSSASLTLGVGGEGFLYKGIGVGAEIGGFAPPSRFDEGVAVFSPNVSYHFLNASDSGKVVPFVTGGYSLFFRSDTLNAVNFGGGVNYWFKDRLGLRIEVRDHVWLRHSETHIVGFRFGLAFR